MSHLKPLFWILHRNAKADVEEDVPEDLLTLIDRSITSIRIPEEITAIGQNAFCYCKALAEVTLPSGLKTIGSNAFYQCPALTTVTIPASVTSVSFNAFAYCTGLTEVTFLGTPSSMLNTTFGNTSDSLIINVPWAEGKVANAPWGATNATINYNYSAEEA